MKDRLRILSLFCDYPKSHSYLKEGKLQEVGAEEKGTALSSDRDLPHCRSRSQVNLEFRHFAS